jgi:hypothetical protein
VLASLNRLTELENVDAGLSAGDRLKLDRLAASRADIVAISARIKELDAQIPLLTDIGDPHRFSTEGRFARWCGVAPVAMSSGEGDGPPRSHRLDLGGNRRVNSVLHIVHVTQARCHPEAQAYMTRRAAENKSKRAARRAHKRQLASVIMRRMWNDAYKSAHANSTPLERGRLTRELRVDDRGSAASTPRTSNAGVTGRWRCAGAPPACSRPASSSTASTVTCTYPPSAPHSNARSPSLSVPPVMMKT